MTECGRGTTSDTLEALVFAGKSLKFQWVSSEKSLTLVINADGAVNASIAASGR